MTKQNDGAFFVERYANDPVRYCKEVLQYEPDQWQADDLNATVTNQRIAVASGHGIGKTRLVASKIHWFLSTRPYPQVVVTANTETQLSTKTWRELHKINATALNRDWFVPTATRFALKGCEETWFAAAIAWTEKRSEAFAGTHEQHVLYLFDEASAIADTIWEVSEGAMTTPGAKWCVYGNPTRNTGRFAECFGKFKHRWLTMQIDSRNAKMADKTQLQEWVDDYGEDSDFVRIRVRGVFPRAGSNQFIDCESVNKCLVYKSEGHEMHPLVLGVDIARFGDDQCVVCPRQGRRVYPLIKWRGMDTMQSAGRIAHVYEQYRADGVLIDGGGVGGGVIDRVKQLIPSQKVFEVNFGGSPNNKQKYFNKRAEMWGDARDAIITGIELPNDNELVSDLTAVEYGFTAQQQIQLEKKEDMKKRGLSSPDCADALACTYAEKILKYRQVTKPAPQYRYAGQSATSWMSS
jgi:hypothetical protein